MSNGRHEKYHFVLETHVQHLGILQSGDHSGKCPHRKAVPRRNTDVKDSEWITDLLQHDLLQPSYIPNRNQRGLREFVSYCKSLIQYRTRKRNRLQKMLEGANIKLSSTITDINGKSDQNFLDTILSRTEIDIDKYDGMYHKKVISHNLKATKERSLDEQKGFMSPLQRKMMRELLCHVDELNTHIHHLDNDIDNQMKREETDAVEAIKEVIVLGVTSAQAIISVMGTDMERFQSNAHISF